MTQLEHKTAAAGHTLVAVVLAVAVAVAYAVNTLAPVVSPLTAAVVLGVLARNAGLLGGGTEPGTRWATRVLLRLGVTLLGLQLAVAQILRLGWAQLLVVTVTVTVTFAGTLWLGRLLRLSRGCTLLVATGFSICGASAAAAMNTVSDSDEEDLATAVTLVTLFGSLAMVVLPQLRRPLGLDPAEFGLWAGASVHEVAQVVATASVAGSVALGVAVTVKLTRVVLLAPLVAGSSLLRRHASRHASRCGSTPGTAPPPVPLFVLGFLAMLGLRSLGVVPPGLLEVARLVSTLLFTGALFGLGAAVNLRTTVRTGGRAFVLGACSTLIATGVSYLGVLWAL